MAKPHYFLKGGEKLELDATNLFRGYTNAPSYYVSSVRNGKVKIDEEGKVIYQPTTKGFDTIQLLVKDAEGSKMARKVNIFIK